MILQKRNFRSVLAHDTLPSPNFPPTIPERRRLAAGRRKTGDFTATALAPMEWSMANNGKIAWKLKLPEAGQNTPVVSDGPVFFPTLKSESGKFAGSPT